MGYGEIDISDASNAGLFAIPSFFITLRESLEAAIIVSVLLGLLDRLDLKHLKAFVWIGVLAATAVCILAAIILSLILYIVQENVLEGDTQVIVEAILSMLASILISVVAFSISNVMAIHDKYSNRMADQIGELEEEESITKSSILFLSFTTVFREGIETIIFFIGIGAAYPVESLPIPAVTGMIVGTVLGVLLYRFGGKLSIAFFFRFTMVLLVFIGAGIFSVGVSQLQYLGAFGEYAGIPEEERAPMLQHVFDIRDCCSLESNQFWVIMRVLFGYTPNPSGVEMLSYFLYHIVVWLSLVLRFKHKAKKEAKHKAIKQAKKDIEANNFNNEDMKPKMSIESDSSRGSRSDVVVAEEVEVEARMVEA